jgi:hypothetical protein
MIALIAFANSSKCFLVICESPADIAAHILRLTICHVSSQPTNQPTKYDCNQPTNQVWSKTTNQPTQPTKFIKTNLVYLAGNGFSCPGWGHVPNIGLGAQIGRVFALRTSPICSHSEQYYGTGDMVQIHQSELW